MLKKLFSVAVLLAMLFLSYPAFGAGHSAALNWSAPSDAVSSTTYSIYRSNETCPAAPDTTFTLLTTGVTGTSYTDTSIGVGNWCYYVEQVQNSVSSAPSNMAGGTAAPLAPIMIGVTVK